MQNVQDQAIVQEYGEHRADYGGAFHDGDLLVVLVTGNRLRHETALHQLVQQPDLLQVRLTERSWADVGASRQRVDTTLLGADAHPQVQAVGIGLSADRFVIRVGIDPYGPQAATALQAAVTPEPVEVYACQPARWLSPAAQGR